MSLFHIIKLTMSTTATSSTVALSQLINLSLKDNSWDIDKLHTMFDLLIAMLTAAEEQQSTGTQLLYLMYLIQLQQARSSPGPFLGKL